MAIALLARTVRRVELAAGHAATVPVPIPGRRVPWGLRTLVRPIRRRTAEEATAQVLPPLGLWKVSATVRVRVPAPRPRALINRSLLAPVNRRPSGAIAVAVPPRRQELVSAAASALVWPTTAGTVPGPWRRTATVAVAIAPAVAVAVAVVVAVPLRGRDLRAASRVAIALRAPTVRRVELGEGPAATVPVLIPTRRLPWRRRPLVPPLRRRTVVVAAAREARP